MGSRHGRSTVGAWLEQSQSAQPALAPAGPPVSRESSSTSMQSTHGGGAGGGATGDGMGAGGGQCQRSTPVAMTIEQGPFTCRREQREVAHRRAGRRRRRGVCGGERGVWVGCAGAGGWALLAVRACGSWTWYSPEVASRSLMERRLHSIGLSCPSSASAHLSEWPLASCRLAYSGQKPAPFIEAGKPQSYCGRMSQQTYTVAFFDIWRKSRPAVR